MTHSGGKPHTNVGYKGQRYEVHGIMHDGTDELFGWTNDKDGGGLIKSAKLWPRYKDAYVIEKQTNEIEVEPTEGK